MVSYIKEMSEDQKIRELCQAREKYECRLTSEYNRGARDLLIAMVRDGEITLESAAKRLDMTEEELRKLINKKDIF